MLILNRKVTLHKLREKFVRFPSSCLGFILSRVRLSSGGHSLILVATTPQVAWIPLTFTPKATLLPLFSIHFHFIYFFVLNSCSWIFFCYMPMVHHLVRPWPPLMFTLLPFYSTLHSIYHFILIFSSLPLWSEPSHLLNHLVKFVSSGNLP